ncbi:NlpC/P60 family protein [Oribacterium parvum]|jgi:cell wall hydrolase; N-acetylmuramoyl-L-alanine amidase (fragment)|uniref:C40 family peptidase n=1 Tax=Oribacterium parvum TaxID=1501329 RepID=UPI0028EA54A5|nr:NlpC/P60 family protein [Oribacterium parvum]
MQYKSQNRVKMMKMKKKNIIRRLSMLVLLLALSFSLYSCKKAGNPSEKEENKASVLSAGEIAGGETEKASESTLKLKLEDKIKTEQEEALEQYQNLGLIQCDSYINFRSDTNENDIRNIIGLLRNGAGVEVLESDVEGKAGWAKVRSGGLEGYIVKNYLLEGEEAKEKAREYMAPRVTILADKLRIRSTPEIVDGNTLSSCAKGERYIVLSRSGKDFLKISADTLEGVEEAYISSKSENVRLEYGLDEARSLNLRQKVLNMYDNLGVSKAQDYINIRSSPEDKGIENIIGKFPSFAGGNILGEENGWLKIESGGITGYVKAELVARGKEAESLAVEHATVMAIVNTDALNVRSSADLNSSAWTKITKDQRYSVINQLDGWVQLELDSGDDDEGEQGAFVSTRDNNVSVSYALYEALSYRPAQDRANQAAKRRSDLVNFACQFVGNPYVWGGTSLTHGCDCSGFTQTIMGKYGVSLPRVSREQAKTGVKVSSENIKPGDLIFYANRRGVVNHVGIYIGNGQVVNAASRRSGIRIYRWNYRTPVAIRNVLGE